MLLDDVCIFWGDYELPDEKENAVHFLSMFQVYPIVKETQD